MQPRPFKILIVTLKEIIEHFNVLLNVFLLASPPEMGGASFIISAIISPYLADYDRRILSLTKVHTHIFLFKGKKKRAGTVHDSELTSMSI